ncbi:MAG: acetylglutamate kinase [Phycisphaerales bacterium]|nr:MAG: acetylglutamate kinase [Phycisphaerales bacterium]
MNATEGITVVKLGGALLDDAAALAMIARTIAAFEGPVIVVHGGGAEVDRRLAAAGIVSEKIEGVRVTPSEAMAEVVAALAGVVNHALVAALQSAGANAVGLTLTDGGACVCARKTMPAGLGRVGEVVGGEGALWLGLVRDGFVPVLSSIGAEADGALNVNADEAAAWVAKAVAAASLVLLTDVEGVRGADGSTIGVLDLAEIERLIADGVIVGGMAVKCRSAASAAAASGVPVRIASWRDAGALSDGSRGTVVHALHGVGGVGRRRPGMVVG